MEEKINVAEILKNKSQGTKLYSRICGAVELKKVIDVRKKKSIVVKELDSNNQHRFWHDGNFFRAGQCVLQPSENMADWSKFSWKKGDVLVSNDGKCKVIFDRFDDDTYTSFVGKYYVECYGKNDELQDYEEEHYGDTVNYTKESEETAKTYINTIEERLSGKLNHETLEIEKVQPDFKDGDIAFADYGNRQDVFIVSDKTELSEGYSSFISLDLNSITLSMGCRTTFFKKDVLKLRLATEEEKQQLFSALEKKGKSWDSDKKAIVNLNPNVELKPFDKVVVRCNEADKWSIDLFSYKVSNGYICTGDAWFGYCLPYNEETAKLVGTTNNVEG